MTIAVNLLPYKTRILAMSLRMRGSSEFESQRWLVGFAVPAFCGAWAWWSPSDHQAQIVVVLNRILAKLDNPRFRQH